MGVRLSEEEAWAELGAAHTGILTTLRRDGRPVSLPVWFATVGRRIYVVGGWGSCGVATGLMSCTESVGITPSAISWGR